MPRQIIVLTDMERVSFELVRWVHRVRRHSQFECSVGVVVSWVERVWEGPLRNGDMKGGVVVWGRRRDGGI